MVERPNQTVKHMLWKTLHTLSLPNEYAAYLVPGVVNIINDITHTTTNKSPHHMVFGTPASLSPISMGDNVIIINTLRGPGTTIHNEFGIFCGVLSSNSV
eukprot:GHVR01110333.1.p1 GENE.GHVR01110333.1~~GHVR01110333.1.p1  ORF type:complete len:100 (-),score=23.03 GHVR01110333.1:210-509(-)